MHRERLSIVLKTVERCNLNCSYCYFFNSVDDAYKRHPPYISSEVIRQTAVFLRQGALDCNCRRVVIGLHGGEPMLQKKKDFTSMCQTFVDALQDVAKVQFTMQTNGTQFDTEWMDLIEQYDIGVGVSIDGLPAHHDAYRVDHRGRGSYERVAEGIAFYQAEAQKRKISPVGALSVMNPNFDGREIYQHFVHNLQLTSFDFLIPDNNYALPPARSAQDYGRFMCQVLDAWTEEDRDEIKIRFIASLLGIFCGGAAKGVRHRA